MTEKQTVTTHSTLHPSTPLAGLTSAISSAVSLLFMYFLSFILLQHLHSDFTACEVLCLPSAKQPAHAVVDIWEEEAGWLNASIANFLPYC